MINKLYYRKIRIYILKEKPKRLTIRNRYNNRQEMFLSYIITY